MPTLVGDAQRRRAVAVCLAHRRTRRQQQLSNARLLSSPTRSDYQFFTHIIHSHLLSLALVAEAAEVVEHI